MLMSLAFLLEVKIKKSKKLTKIIKIEEVIIHIFWESWWISIKFSGNVTYDDIKMIKIQSFTLSSDCIYFIYILSLRGNFNIRFCQIGHFHSIYIRTSLGPIVWQITR